MRKLLSDDLRDKNLLFLFFFILPPICFLQLFKSKSRFVCLLPTNNVFTYKILYLKFLTHLASFLRRQRFSFSLQCHNPFTIMTVAIYSFTAGYRNSTVKSTSET